MQRIDHTDDYALLRRQEYPDESAQVHALVKVVQAMLDGTIVPADAQAVLDEVSSVKQKYPKEGQ